MEKRLIEVDEYERRLIIASLNDTRNELMAQGRDTGFVDDTLLTVIDAPAKKQKKRTEAQR
ncbi:hypothetical protein [Christensenella hongkongensis]|uniref:Uncharacterized protein n=1 Tax=Christensenella hongkongensis TaxID=270498 RepID=A0A0M2NNX5_9FIRM|nr:hypothetical protein [Christensenella hongkongensis]KKI51915.1 hypothetical protein CHK_0598 [Christensenella hongkongensis]TCW24515.1 hypothetical protein EV208_12214 [Christensenella hongkongensis]